MSFTNAFASIKTQVPTRNPRHSIITEPKFSLGVIVTNKFSFTKLYATNEEEVSFSDSDATALGVTGLVASVIMLYSESVLFRTGCGLPAGPLGLYEYGAAEGVSYLGVVVLVGYSLFTKFRTVSEIISCNIAIVIISFINVYIITSSKCFFLL
jgi:hypothetical protein